MTLGAVALAEAPLAGDVAADVRILTVAQVAPAATQSATVSVTVTASLAQTAPAATQSATIPLTDLDLTIAQTAPAATQSATIPLSRNLQPRRNPDKHPRGRLGRMAGVG